jgi:hypothetical protein
VVLPPEQQRKLLAGVLVQALRGGHGLLRLLAPLLHNHKKPCAARISTSMQGRELLNSVETSVCVGGGHCEWACLRFEVGEAAGEGAGHAPRVAGEVVLGHEELGAPGARSAWPAVAPRDTRQTRIHTHIRMSVKRN